MWPSWWCAIREKMLCSKTGTKVIVSTPTIGRTVVPEQAQLGLPWRDGRAHAARASPELPDYRQRSDPSHVSGESGLSQLGDPLCRPGRLLPPSLSRVAGQDQGSRCPPPSRTTLPATGHAAVFAPASAPRAVGGESQACHHRQTSADSRTGTDSLRLGGGADPDPASFPH